ncbi:hypothetical protein P153DRAFT_354780 [Dothidotthia symphoricarpi CBS 119687]|uniref:Uncharacterized protein n=1 Tax=Dothidotthia symphoricarpi CBS 119687 TaxID=1392245 RepID=A0A6A6AMI0_9PLEO|nr:uncharacterized protein P153DRAFT_354780 [Dothidotthia symphoricarpi CBS 119687]KAF2132134.1 hypothetical protein P153DRAFT_354780 [Dothidotthia symphoricarpi CBS 119687]
MADPVANSIAGVSLLLSLTSSIVSAGYDIERAIRNEWELTRSLNWRADNNSLKHMIQVCEEILEGSTKLPGNLGGHRSNHTSANLVQSCENQEKDTGTLVDTCRKVVHYCWHDVWATEPILRKFVNWATHIGDSALHQTRLRIPEMLRRPSPSTLLVSWLILALAVAAYHETHPGNMRRKALLLGSLFIALLIGVVEGSGTSTVLLTDLPWCLSLGILLDMIVHRLLVVAPIRAIQETGTKEEEYHMMEKGIY